MGHGVPVTRFVARATVGFMDIYGYVRIFMDMYLLIYLELDGVISYKPTWKWG